MIGFVHSQQPLLSDEQAAEVEELLLTADREQSSVKPSVAPTATHDEPEPDWLQNVLDASKLAEAPLPPLPASAVAAHFDLDRRISETNHDDNASVLDSSIVSVESLVPSITSTNADDSVASSRLDQSRLDDGLGSVAGSFVSLSTNNSEATINDPDVFFIPEYPPVSPKEVFVDGGIHYFEDGNFWMEIPGLMECDEDDDDDLEYPVFQKKTTKIRFSSGTIQVFSTYSVNDYDRRNEDVDPVAASAEYELEKRVEKMHVFPVELMKGPEGLGLSIIGECW